MHILFVAYNSLDLQPGHHIFNLANHLCRRGIHVTVCVPHGKERTSTVGKPAFKTIDFSDIEYDRWSDAVTDSGPVDIIHAWTPREVVRRMVVRLVDQLKCPYIIHMEDNEEGIVVANTNRSIQELETLSEQQLDQVIGIGMSYPKQYRDFLAHAQGVTAIMDRLFEFKPDHVPGFVFWPGYEDELDWSAPADPHLRSQLGIVEHEYVLVYTGNIHATNVQEVYSLYLAVALLNSRGVPVKLVRTGTDYASLDNLSLKLSKKYCVNLGFIPRYWMPRIIALADALVQPGKADAFNEYRFPSKLPEFLASGRPVLLPHTNIGRFLTNGQDCILLNDGNGLEITQKLEQLLPDKELRNKIGAKGREFASKNLQWKTNTEKLHNFYEQVLTANRV